MQTHVGRCLAAGPGLVLPSTLNISHTMQLVVAKLVFPHTPVANRIGGQPLRDYFLMRIIGM